MLNLIDPLTANSQNWVESTLRFIEMNHQDSNLKPELLRKLEQLHQSHKIMVKECGSKRTGGYNRLLGTITLNSDRLGFLKRDFGRQLRGMEAAEDARKQHVCDQHTRAILELSGVLVHEGAHALHRAWRAKIDETIAFTCEQEWYAHLHNLESTFKEVLQRLAHDAEYDAFHSPAYKRLGLTVASKIIR
jgi:hypothetical protein